MLDQLSSSLAASLGRELVPEPLAEALAQKLPNASFVRWVGGPQTRPPPSYRHLSGGPSTWLPLQAHGARRSPRKGAPRAGAPDSAPPPRRRLALRCGKGLFVTEDLLRPGPYALALVSLQSSMAGAAMKEGLPVFLEVGADKCVPGCAACCGPGLQKKLDPLPSSAAPPRGRRPAPAGSCLEPHASCPASLCPTAPRCRAQRWPGGRTARVACYPIGVPQQPPPCAPHPHGSAAGCGPKGISYIGALQVGLAAAPAPEGQRAELEALAAALGPYLLLVSLTKLQDMARMMALPLGECACCAGEEVRRRGARGGAGSAGRARGWAGGRGSAGSEPLGRNRAPTS